MDPSGGGVGKAAGELMKEMQQAQQELQTKQQGPGQAGGAQGNFQSHMQAHQTNQAGQVNNTQQAGEVSKATNILKTAKINANHTTTRVGEAAKTERSKMASMLEHMVEGQDKMTGIMNMALSGRQFSPPELLAMQAGVYRFSQEMELTSKVVEKATSGIKQTMNTQV